MRRLAVVPALLALVLALPALATDRESTQTAPRLEGAWRVSGTFSAVENVTNRRAGQAFRESWRFAPRCRRGPCAVELRRAGRTILLRRSGATYAGRRSYVGAFFCDGTRYPKGTLYVESWTLRIRRSGPGTRGRRATSISGTGATVGRSRRDLPCARVVSLEKVEFTAVPRQGKR